MTISEYIEQPDVEVNLVNFLSTHPKITPFNAVVSASLVGYTNDKRWIRLQRIGGSPDYPVPDHPRVHFDVYAPLNERDVCSAMARTVRAVIYTVRGLVIGPPGMKISRVEDGMGLMWLPDQSGLPRYQFTLNLDTRAI